MKNFLFITFIIVTIINYTIGIENDDNENIDLSVIQQIQVLPKNYKNFPISDDKENKLTTRIVGGKYAKRDQFPYQVGLSMKFPKGFAWCGASLLSENYVLTAGHCLHGAEKGYVYLGTHNIYDKNETKTVMNIFPKDWIKHPKYNDLYLTDDVGLIKLPKSYSLQGKNQFVKLPPPTMDTEKGVAIASGWGRYSNNKNVSLSDVLRYVELRLITVGWCKFYHGASVRETNICGSPLKKTGVCMGDSGGPLVVSYRDEENVQIGITSFVSIRGCESGYPSVFTRVSSYVDWIKNVTKLSFLEEM